MIKLRRNLEVCSLHGCLASGAALLLRAVTRMLMLSLVNLHTVSEYA